MSIKHEILQYFGLKWNPFIPDVPVGATVDRNQLERFYFKVENLVIDGGFAMITGEPGTGKSVALRQLSARLSGIRELQVAQYTRPQSGVADFYREMGHLFGVDLKPSNRFCGFKDLRERWLTHMESALLKPVLLIDEAQELQASVLSELRILSSIDFDSRNILAVVLCGDGRLLEKFRIPDLVPLGSRVRTRLELGRASIEELKEIFKTCLDNASGSGLMSEGLITHLAELAMGNIRAMMIMGSELLVEAASRKVNKLDEDLFFSIYNNPSTKKPRGRKKPT